MRKTNLNKPIKHADLKSGDKIRIVREATLKDVRQTTLGNNVKAAIITTDQGAESVTLAITEAETVTLLERDAERVEIPRSAVIVYWQDEDGEDFYARYDSDRQVWIEDDTDEYESTEKLVEYIEKHLKEGTFEVLKRRPLFAEGGLVSGAVAPGRGYYGLGLDPGYVGRLAANILPANIAR